MLEFDLNKKKLYKRQIITNGGFGGFGGFIVLIFFKDKLYKGDYKYEKNKNG